MIHTYKSIGSAIGNMQPVEIRRLNPDSGVGIFAKIEYFIPGGRDFRAEFLLLREPIGKPVDLSDGNLR
jgi:cysteine synthase